jgi:hypothetical protein
MNLKIMLGKRHLIWTCRQNLGKKKTHPISFPNHLLENIQVEPMFPYAMLPYHEKAK